MNEQEEGAQAEKQASGAANLIAPGLPQRQLFRWFFFGFFAFLLYQLILILSLFANVIVWAVSMTLVFWPLHRKFLNWFNDKSALASGCSTVAVLLLVLIPLAGVFAIVIAQSAQVYPTVQEWILAIKSPQSASLVDLLPEFMRNAWQALSDWLASIPVLADFNLADFTLRSVNSLSASLADFSAATARNLLFGLINLILILFLMYFCFRDGQRFLSWFFDIIPMESSHAQAVALRVYQTVTAVIRGALITAGIQGALALIGYLIAGVPLALFFGVLTGFAALIPVVGAALVWLPIGLFVFMQDPQWGLFILIWGFLLVSMIDNLLKPILIGNQTRMPILLIFCAMIGGANIYGVSGFLIGPILIAVLLAFITIYRDDYLNDHKSKAAQGAGSESEK